MNIGAFQKFSLIEYPGKICAIVFCQGCNFRCPYCYNRELVLPDLFVPPLPEEDLLSFLAKRKGKLDAVTITGGEPALQPGLLAFVSRLKEMGYLVKVDTNGSMPDVLAEWIRSRQVDYIAMDIKGPLEKYGGITRSRIRPGTIRRSIGMLLDSGIDHEFRTTVVSPPLSREDILAAAGSIRGARRYVLQRFIASKTLDPSFMNAATLPDEDFRSLLEDLRAYIQEPALR